MGKRALALLVVSLAACGGSSGTSAPNAGDYQPVLAALCDVIDRCPDALPQPIAYRSQSECEAILWFVLTCRLGDVNGTFTITQTTPKTTAGAAQACATWLSSATCDQIQTGTAGTPCENIWGSSGATAGQTGQALGETCDDGAQHCGPDLYCDRSVVTDAGVDTCRVCKAIPTTAGDACALGYLCGQGFYCASDITCEPTLADSTTCSYSNMCMSGFCNNNTHVCDPKGNTGDACTNTGDCRLGFCDTTNHCAPLESNGQACRDNTECQYADCDPTTKICGAADGTQCSYDGQCAGWCDTSTYLCAPKVGAGQSCNESPQCTTGYCDVFSTHTCTIHCYADTDCQSTEFCDWSSEMCRTKLADGVSCDQGTNCASGTCLSSGVCGKPPQLGDACSSSTDCYPKGYCKNSVCAQRHAPGAACDAFEGCEDPFVCLNSVCTIMNLTCAPARTGQLCAFFRVCDDQSTCDFATFTCKPRLGQGASCYSSDQCQGQLHCASSTQTCQPRVGAGATCASSDDCTSGLFCSGGTCMAGPVGQPCDTYEAPCPDGYFCDYESNYTCQAPLPLGAQNCNQYDRPCEADLYCDPSTGCSSLKTVGQDCRSWEPCAAGLYCDDSTLTCKTDAQQGDSCIGAQCAGTLWCDYNTETCQPRKTTGQPCSDGTECASGACDTSYGCLASSMCVMQ